MKHALQGIFILLLCAACSKNEYASLENRLSITVGKSQFVHDTTGFHALPEIDSLFKSRCHMEENRYPYYHVADLNADGKKDFIYSGFCSPYPEVWLYLNTGAGWKFLFNTGGEVVALTKTKAGSVVDILFTGCCGADEDFQTQLTIGKDSILSDHTIHWFVNTELPLSKPFKKIVVSGQLRTFPGIDDHHDGDLSPGELQGNHLVKISVPTEVIQLNSLGRWRLVVYPKTNSQSWIGWINVE